MILKDFLKALGQMDDAAFRGVLFRGVGLTVALLALLTFGVQWILPETISVPWIGEIGWLSNLLSGFILIVMIVLSVFLMIPVAVLFLGFFLERIAAAVEAKHYSHLPVADPVPMSDTIQDATKFFGLMIVVNLLAAIIYVMSTVFAPVVFWVVNGILLGREYFQLVAMRRLGRAGADALRAKHRFHIWTAGFLMAIPLTVPIVNLFIPILGVATFTHIFHRLNKSG